MGVYVGMCNLVGRQERRKGGKVNIIFALCVLPPGFCLKLRDWGLLNAFF